MRVENIPYSLKQLFQWSLWATLGDGDTDNLALDAFDQIYLKYEEAPTQFGGIGIALTEQDNYVGGILRGCRNVRTGVLSDAAKRLIAAVPTYWEVSPDGTGITFIGCSSTGKELKGNGLTFYSKGKFLPITGERIGECLDPIELSAVHIGVLRDYAHALPDGVASSAVITALQDHGLYLKPIDSDRHLITCPWRDSHPPYVQKETLYIRSPVETFHCPQSSCVHRNINDLYQALGITQHVNFPFVYPGQFIIESDEYLIDGWLPKGDVSLLYAPKLNYKTFIALDMALCISAGVPWHGHKVEKGLVIYIAGEGNTGLQRRCAGWSRHNDIPLSSLAFALSKWPMAVMDDECLPAWEGYIEQVEAHYEMSTALIVLDTVSSNFGPGDENTTSDMVQFLNRLAHSLRPTPKCSLLLVHHPGKDTSRGARGSYALEANTSAIFTIEKSKDAEDQVTLIGKALKDGKLPTPKQFRAKSVSILPTTTTLVMELALTERELDVLRRSQAGESQHAIGEAVQISQPAVSRIQAKLRQLGHLKTF